MVGDGPPLVLDRTGSESYATTATRYNVHRRTKPRGLAGRRRRRRLSSGTPISNAEPKSRPCFFAVILLGDTATALGKKASTTQAVQPRQLSLLRVNVTGQGI